MGASFPVSVVQCSPRPRGLLLPPPIHCSPAACRGSPKLLGSGDCHHPWPGECCARLGLEGSCLMEVGRLQKGACYLAPTLLSLSSSAFLTASSCSLQNHVCFAPPRIAPGCSLLFMLTFKNPLFHTTKVVLQPAWPCVPGAMFAVPWLFVFFGNCKAKKSYEGSRIKSRCKLVCLVV